MNHIPLSVTVFKILFQKFLLVVMLTLLCSISFSQTTSDSLLQIADSLFKQKQFLKAAPLCEQAALLADNKISKNTNYFYTAYAYARSKDSANSFKFLDLAITTYGFNDILSLQNDDAFLFMNKSSRWEKLLASIEPTYTSNPLNAKVIDTDISNFWAAYDQVQRDPSNAVKIYKEQYIDKGTMALQDYYLHKIQSVESFVYIHNLYSKFYKSIRPNSLKAATLKKQYLSSFVKLKKLYPEAVFPNIYFVMGKFNSAGTASSNGLIIGIDMRCYSATTDTTELGIWQKKNITKLSGLPYTVAHELIHFLQNAMAPDTTLLRAAIIEGMADFIGELISGKNTNERLHVYARGKETMIWSNFKKEMYANRAYNWIANSEQETATKPADLGYWVGYQICKAYYDHIKNKQQAIFDMLHIKDYKAFLKISKLEERFK